MTLIIDGLGGSRGGGAMGGGLVVVSILRHCCYLNHKYR